MVFGGKVSSEDYENLAYERNDLKMKLKIAVEALEWIADKKSDTDGVHSMRSERTAKQTLEKLFFHGIQYDLKEE